VAMRAVFWRRMSPTFIATSIRSVTGASQLTILVYIIPIVNFGMVQTTTSLSERKWQ
jgi:hypothetical protein